MTSASPVDKFNAASDPPRRKRPPPLSIRISEEERMRLKREAGDGSVHALARHRLLGSRSGMPAARIDKAALGEALAKLGRSHLASNMNQIAKAANTGALPVTAALESELREACADIRAMRLALTDAIGIKPKG